MPSPRSFLWLVAVTVVAVLATVWTLIQTTPDAHVRLGGEPVFPALRESPQRVAEIEVESAGQRFTLMRRDDDRWIAPDRFDYPVRADQVAALVGALADMRVVEAKTARPDRHHRLRVEDPGLADSLSRRVVLRDEGGDVLAEAILGRTRWRFTAGEDLGTYLRRGDEDQVWLVTGRADIPEIQRDWLERNLLELREQRIAQVAVSPPEGPAYHLRRDRPDEAFALVSEVPEELGDDSPALDPEAVTRLANSMGWLRFDEVTARDHAESAPVRAEARFVTLDGLAVLVRLHEADDGQWLTFAFEASETLEPETRDMLEKQGERLGGWAYRFSESTMKRFWPPFADLFEGMETAS